MALGRDATRGMPCSHEAGNVIETPEQKGHFVEPKPFSASPALFST